jgi:hypothetical protein
MNNAPSFLLSVLVLVLPPSVHAESAPRFEDYGVSEVFQGRPAPVDLRSNPDALRFKTELREGAAKGPNFAGHFTVVSWGCGTSCQSIMLVDASSGRVMRSPLVSELGQDFRKDSRLLVLNPPSEVKVVLERLGCSDQSVDSWLTTSHYFEWNGKQFRHIVDINPCAKPEP